MKAGFLKKAALLMLVLALGPNCTAAAETGTEGLVETEQISGKIGEEISWNLTEEGILEITGQGNTVWQDTEEVSGVSYWSAYEDRIKGIHVSGITRIPSSTFSGMEGIESIVLEAPISEIDTCAFIGCSDVTDLTLPNSLTRIELGAFESCSALEEITFPENLEYIGNNAFAACESLTKIRFTGIDTAFGSNVFNSCGRLSDVELPSGLKKIGAHMFANCPNLRKVDIPISVEEIGYSAFRNDNSDLTLHFEEEAHPPVFDQISTGETAVKIEYPIYKNGWEAALQKELVGNLEGKPYCNKVLDVTGLESDHPYSQDEEHVWELRYEGESMPTRCIYLLFDERTALETNYDDYLYVYDENGQLFGKYRNNELAGKELMVPGSGVRLELSTDADTEYWGFAVTKAEAWFHEWDEGKAAAPEPGEIIGKRIYTCSICNETRTEYFESTYTEKGWINSEIFWGITRDGRLDIIGEGGSVWEEPYEQLYSYVQDSYGRDVTSAPWGAYRSQILQIDVSGVREIAANAFKGLSEVRSVSLGYNLQEIKINAFANCGKLEAIYIPDSVKEVGSAAFQNCSSLTQVRLSESLEGISSYAFSWCTALKKAELPSGLKWIGNSAFAGDESLDISSFPDGLETIVASAFDDCRSLKEAILPASVKTIGFGAFRSCTSLEKITLPAGLLKIEDYLLNGCSNLTEVEIPYGVTSIGNSAFNGCAKALLEVPDTVESIGESAFAGCNGLTKANLEHASVIGNGAFSGCSNLGRIRLSPELIMLQPWVFNECTNLELDRAKLPNNLKYIGTGAFKGCEKLEAVVIPAGVTQIDDSAFAGCESLASIEVAEENADYTSINGVLFNKEGSDLLNYPMGAANESYEVPASVSRVEAYAFEGSRNLKELKIGENVVWIGRGIIRNCTGLEKLTLPFLGMAEGADDPRIEHALDLIDEVSRTPEKFKVKDLTILRGKKIANLHGLEYLEKIELPADAEKIEQGAFSSCKNLKEVIFHDEITEIGPYAFAGCSSLILDRLPKKLRIIGEDAFYDTSLITEVTFPDTLESLGSGNFTSARKAFFTGNMPVFEDSFYVVGEGSLQISYPICDPSWNVTGLGQYASVTWNGIHLPIEETVKIEEHSCTTDGAKTFVCSFCGETIAEVYEPAGHKYVETGREEADCSRDGFADYECSVCQETLHEVLPATGMHVWDEGTITEPDCTRMGYTKYTCLLCKEAVYYENWKDALSHSLEVSAVEPTCTDRGYTLVRCQNCSYEYRYGFVPKSEHTYETETVDPTCAAEGYTSHTCSICGDSYVDEIIEASGHDFDVQETAPTCQTHGYTTYTCRKCGYAYSAQYVRAAGHQWEAIQRTEPTYLTDGVEVLTCANCGEEKTMTLMALGQIDLSQCEVYLTYGSRVYTGTERTNLVHVRYGQTRIDSSDYEVTYRNNINAGTAEVCIQAREGDVSVTGSASAFFEITRREQILKAVISTDVVHMGETAEISCEGIGDIHLSIENDKVAAFTDDRTIMALAVGTAEIVISADGDENNLPAQTVIEIRTEAHDPMIDEAVRPTLDETGLTQGSHCVICGKILEKQEVLPKCRVEMELSGGADRMALAVVRDPMTLTAHGFVIGETQEVTLDTPGRIRIAFEGFEDNTYRCSLEDAYRNTGKYCRAYVVYTNAAGEEVTEYSESCRID